MTLSLFAALFATLFADGKTDYSGFGYSFDNETVIPMRTAFRLTHGETALVVDLEADCRDLTQARSREGGPWSCGEHFEIFLLPPGRKFIQFAVGANGARWDNRSADGKPDGSWSAKAKCDGNHWTVRVSLPWTVFGSGRPAVGDTWKINVCRGFTSEKGETVASTYAHVGSVFRNYERFETLRFGSAADLAAADDRRRRDGIVALERELEFRGVTDEFAARLEALRQGASLGVIDEIRQELAALDAVVAGEPDAFARAVRREGEILVLRTYAKDSPLSFAGLTEVRLVLRPSPISYVRVLLALPPKESWNGRLYGFGSGGPAGYWSDGEPVSAARKGAAAMYCDLGSSRGVKCSDHVMDFGHRALHVATLAAKRLVREYYGKPAFRSYFFGESTGGGEGLHEAERYPEDYDGIVAGVPANTRLPLHIYFAWSRRQTCRADGSEAFTPVEFEAMRLAGLDVLPSAVNPNTGARYLTDTVWTQEREDAVIARACELEPSLDTADKRARMHRLFSGPVVGDRTIHGGVPFGTNPVQATGNQWMFRWRFGGDRDPATATGAELLAWAKDWGPDLNAVSGDLSAFNRRGGKLIVYGGLADPLVPVSSMRDWFAHAGKETPSFASCCRFFLLPGRHHGAGGECTGVLDFDREKAIVDWVEKGVVPDAVDCRLSGGGSCVMCAEKVEVGTQGMETSRRCAD